MKNQCPALIVFLAFLYCSFSLRGQEVRLEDGDTFTYEFRGLSFERATPGASEQVSFAVNFGAADRIDRGEAVTFRLFENSPSEPPFYVVPFSFSESEPLDHADRVEFALIGRHWTDHQGVFQIEVNSGTMLVTSFRFTVTQEGDTFSGVFAVPEPSTVGLFIFGAVCLVGWFWVRGFGRRPWPGIARLIQKTAWKAPELQTLRRTCRLLGLR